MRLVRNTPLNTQVLAALWTDREDLYLVWPLARFPFDHGQWRAALGPETGSLSFLVYEKEDLVGHAALKKAELPRAWTASYLYLRPELRGQGRGRRLLGILEAYARDRLGAEQLSIVVRTYNPGAWKCYAGFGFRETGREGTLVRMAKPVAAPPRPSRECGDRGSDPGVSGP